MRRGPIVPLPGQVTPETKLLVDALHRSLGFLSSYLELALVREPTSLSAASSAGGTVVAMTSHLIEWPDIGVDQWRLTAYAEYTGNAKVAAYVVNGVELARVTLSAALTLVAGPWTMIGRDDLATIAGDQEGHLVIIGDGTGNTKLYAVTLQARTVSRAM